MKFDRSSENMKYDYLIVGAGLFGAVFAYEAKKVILNFLFIIAKKKGGEYGNT